MSEAILTQYDRECGAYDAYQKNLVPLIGRLLGAINLQAHSVTGRVKTKDSLREKINRPDKNYASLSDITDICGVRIITYLPADIDKAAVVIEREFEIDKTNSVDKRTISDPDRFGYSSLHYIASMLPARRKLPEYREWKDLKIEIQIRTIIQHAWAEIEHDLGYKSTIAIPTSVKRQFFRLAALLEIADGEFQAVKNSIDAYKGTVEKSIETSPETVGIDSTSLTEFVKGNKQVEKCESDISARSGRIIKTVNNRIIQSFASYLKWAGISTIAELSTEFQKNSRTVTEVAVSTLTEGGSERTHGPLPAGVSLLYLCYVKISKESGLERLVAFYNKFIFGPDESSRRIAAQRMSERVRNSPT